MRRFRPQVSLSLLATLMVPMQSAALSAEEPAVVAAGQWVRVSVGGEAAGGKELTHDKRTTTFDVNGQPMRMAKPGTTLEGQVQMVGPEALVLKGASDTSPIVVPVGAVTSMDVRRRESKKVAGVLLGALGGGAIGYAVGAATAPACTPEFLGCLGHDLSAPGGGLLGVLAGAVLGAAIAPGAKWDTNVRLDHVRVSLGPTRGGGFGGSVSVGF
jgi:hypothetical protein